MSSKPSSPTNILDVSKNTNLTNYIINQTINDGLTITTNIQGTDVSGTMYTDTSFTTIINNLIDIQIDENLDSQVVITDNITSATAIYGGINTNISFAVVLHVIDYKDELQIF